MELGQDVEQGRRGLPVHEAERGEQMARSGSGPRVEDRGVDRRVADLSERRHGVRAVVRVGDDDRGPIGNAVRCDFGGDPVDGRAQREHAHALDPRPPPPAPARAHRGRIGPSQALERADELVRQFALVAGDDLDLVPGRAAEQWIEALPASLLGPERADEVQHRLGQVLALDDRDPGVPAPPAGHEVGLVADDDARGATQFGDGHPSGGGAGVGGAAVQCLEVELEVGGRGDGQGFVVDHAPQVVGIQRGQTADGLDVAPRGLPHQVETERLLERLARRRQQAQRGPSPLLAPVRIENGDGEFVGREDLDRAAILERAQPRDDPGGGRPPSGVPRPRLRSPRPPRATRERRRRPSKRARPRRDARAVVTAPAASPKGPTARRRRSTRPRGPRADDVRIRGRPPVAAARARPRASPRRAPTRGRDRSTATRARSAPVPPARAR